MIGPFDLRDLWQEDLRDESRRTRGKCPEPYEELAYTAWKLAEEKIPVITVEPERTWVWSDLHLGDESAVAAASRPFNDACRMDRHLLAEWRRTVGDDDTIICLGDVAHPRFWQDPRNMRDLRRCPGDRVLILGNHDVGETERLREAGFTDQYWGALLATDPPAALTHMPLKRRPFPAVNIHGHLHGADAPSPRHANVSVERTDYSPVRLDRVLKTLTTPRSSGQSH